MNLRRSVLPLTDRLHFVSGFNHILQTRRIARAAFLDIATSRRQINCPKRTAHKDCSEREAHRENPAVVVLLESCRSDLHTTVTSLAPIP
jgi:hypothetical protein